MGSKICTFLDRFKVKKNLVREIPIDETLTKINGENYWLWIAYEPKIAS
jgi:transposase-like protein